MSKLSKFFIVCAVICGLGLVLFIIGFACGGIKDIDKVAGRYDWMEGSPGEMKVSFTEAADIRSISSDGVVDVTVLGEEYQNNLNGYMDDGAASEIAHHGFKTGTVVVVRGEKIEAPEIEDEKGDLVIHGSTVADDSVHINLTGASEVPRVIVFAGDTRLEHVDIGNDYCDISLYGIRYEKFTADVCDSDLILECAEGRSTSVRAENSDVGMHGEFSGKTLLDIANSDAEIETSLKRALYTIDAKAAGSNFEIDESEDEDDFRAGHFRSGKGSFLLKINAEKSDVCITFGDTLY